MNTKLYPRYELLYEFKSYSEGKDIGFIDFSTFIDIHSKDKNIVESIKDLESINDKNIRKSVKASTIADKLLMSNFTCEYCGKPLANGFSIDHVFPICEVGTDEVDNLIVTCYSCNFKKSNSKDLIKRNNSCLYDTYEQICPRCKEGTLDIQDSVYGVYRVCSNCGFTTKE